MAKKPATAQERKHMGVVANLGCIACAKLGHYDSPAEIHHIKHQTGIGRRASHFQVIPLCPLHHRQGAHAYHNAPAAFSDTFGSQLELLQQVLEWLAVDGCPCGCTKKTGQTVKSNPYARGNFFYE